MNTKCQICGCECSENELVEVELVESQSNEVVAMSVCSNCLEECEQNTNELDYVWENTKVFDPRHLIMPSLLSSSNSSSVTV